MPYRRIASSYVMRGTGVYASGLRPNVLKISV